MADKRHPKEFFRRLGQGIVNSRVWTSFFRHGWPDNERDQSLTVTSNVLLHLHPVKVRKAGLKITYTWGLGGITVFLFLVLSVTGVLLMFYYVPSVERAYDDIVYLHTSVTSGALIRNLHRWAAEGMVITAILHMCRVFYTGGYRKPREFNWVVGIMLGLLTLADSYTGYLLPWDQLAFWAITVGTNIAGYTPFVGSLIKTIMLGGQDVGQNALLRFYAMHVIAIPGLMLVVLAIHLWRVRKDGGISGSS